MIAKGSVFGRDTFFGLDFEYTTVRFLIIFKLSIVSDFKGFSVKHTPSLIWNKISLEKTECVS